MVPSILDALADPALFGGLFAAPSWAPWKAFLAALFGLPMDDAQLATYRHHTGRLEPPRARFKEAALVCGRRAGKSRTLSLIACYLATVPDHSAHTAPGEALVIAIIAADRRQAKVILGYVSGLLHAVPALAALIEDELAESVRLSNGIAIEVHTGSIGAPRGRTFICVLADEIAFWTTGDGANPDSEIIAAVRPGLATIPGSMLLMASSPYARRGVLFNTFARYFGKDAPILVWRGSTREMNSQIDPRIIEEAFEADPESAEAEYNANFRTDIGQFIDRELLESAVDYGVIVRPPQPGVSYRAFCDASGGRGTAFTAAIAHAEGDLVVLDAIFERRAPFNPSEIVREIAELLRRYGVHAIVGDKYAAQWVVEAFAKEGIRYRASERDRSAIYADSLPLFTSGRARLIESQRAVYQLSTLERRVSRFGGRDRIGHPENADAHDDVANSVCGALVLVAAEAGPSSIRASDLMTPEYAGVEIGYVRGFYTVLWIGIDGRCGWAIIGTDGMERPSLIIADCDVQPWSGGLLDQVMVRLDEFCEQAWERNPQCREQGVHVWTWLPEQLVEAGQAAMYRAFEARLTRPEARRRGWGCEAIDAGYFADPAGLMLRAAAAVSAGKVKLGVAAVERSRGAPLLGALAVRAVEAVEGDPLRMTLLLGISIGLDPEPSHVAPMIPAARVTFG